MQNAKKMIQGSSSQLISFWKHCLQKHMNSYNSDCTQNLFKCKARKSTHIFLDDDDADSKHEDIVYECKTCKTLNKLESNQHAPDPFRSRIIDTNDHIKSRVQNDRLPYELYSIYTYLVHGIHNIKPLVLCPVITCHSNEVPTIATDTFLAKSEEQHQTPVPIDQMPYLSDQIDIYASDIHHQHQYLKPFGSNSSMLDEMLQTGHVTQSAWDKILKRALIKKKQIINNIDYVAKQYSHDYNINRGDLIGVHHLMALLFVTSFSALARDYRSTFRKRDA
eukprot:836613_1